MDQALESWKPIRCEFGPGLDRLRQSADVAFVHDEIVLQLSELLQLRSPARKLSPAELRDAVAAHAGGALAAYGSWFYYPWLKSLVHLVPRDEFRELRTQINRNKITAQEQEKLSRFTIGVVGLSVGQSTAITLALEGVGGSFRLADFDTLAPANMNRVRAGVQSLGINKAVLTAREIFELDPYADISIFPEGVTDTNIDAFLEGLDLLFEESDDLRMKVRLRERARIRGVPVIMGTSDRGLVDIERFDREPDRPLFHGITGPLDEKKLLGMTPYEKIPIAFAVVGPTLSNRLAASLLDISVTLNTWPQLASAVALSSAINTDAARRILLGQFTESGRFFVDLESLVRDGGGEAIPLPMPDESHLPALASEPLPPLDTARPTKPEVPRKITPDEARTLIGYGALAPSGGNCQPWRFVLRRGRILCVHDIARSRSGRMLDFEHSATHLAFGALARNIELAADAMGRHVAIAPFPDEASLGGDLGGDGGERIVCAVEAVAASPHPPSRLARFMAERVTNRRIGQAMPLERAHRAELLEAARRAGARLQIIEQEDARNALGAIIGEGDRIRCLSPSMHREMMSEIRWTRAEALARRDGIDVATLELGPADLVGLRLVSNAQVMKLVKEIGAGKGLELPARKAISGSSTVALLTTQGTDCGAFFSGGRALQDVWLTASANRLALQPMTALLYMFARLERGAGAGLSDDEQASLRRLRQRFRELFDVGPGHAELMLFRLSYAAPPSARSLRHRVDDLLVIEP